MLSACTLQKAGGMPPNGQLPESLVLSSEVFDSGGVYLLDSGADLLLYVDQEAPEQIVQVRGQCGLQDSMAGQQSACLQCLCLGHMCRGSCLAGKGLVTRVQGCVQVLQPVVKPACVDNTPLCRCG